MQVKLFTIVFVIYHTCKKYLNTQLYFTAFCEYKSRSFWCNLSFVDTSLFICLVKRLPPLSLGKTHCNYENKKFALSAFCNPFQVQRIQGLIFGGLRGGCSEHIVPLPSTRRSFMYAKCNPSLGNGWREGQGSFTQVLFQTFSNLSWGHAR